MIQVADSVATNWLIVRNNVILNTLQVISGMIFPTNYLTGAKTGLPDELQPSYGTKTYIRLNLNHQYKNY